MNLFIQIRDGKPHEHPIADWNLYDAFPNIDPNNLPPEFARFERLACNIEIGTYEMPVCTYQWVGNVVKDVWSTRLMTDEERAQKDAELAVQTINLNNNGSVPDVIG
jgi:hypothetical protein